MYSVFNESLFGDNSSPRSESPESRPVERAIEARAGGEDGLGSMVRCLHFAETYLVNRKFLPFSFSFLRAHRVVGGRQRP